MKFNFDFNANAKKYFAISLMLFALIAVATAVFGVKLDLQFRGGSIITYAYDGALDQTAFEQKLESVLNEDVSLQASSDVITGANTFIVSLPGNRSISSDKLVELNDALMADFAESGPRTLEISNVDPTIGKEFLGKCIAALALAMVLMMLYVALRFSKIGGLSAGAMGVVALLHDCVIVFGVFVIFGIPINDNFIAVILTILGFSLNDTIVIYDRIRENKRLYGSKLKVGELVSKSINQSLTRSINTSVTAIMSMVVVTVVAMIYGVDSIFSFSFPLILGLISGSYSSICIAGPLWVKWMERKARLKSA